MLSRSPGSSLQKQRRRCDSWPTPADVPSAQGVHSSLQLPAPDLNLPAAHWVHVPPLELNTASDVEWRTGGEEYEGVEHIDFWSANLYPGKDFASSGNFKMYEVASDMPLLVSEYGIDAYVT